MSLPSRKVEDDKPTLGTNITNAKLSGKTADSQPYLDVPLPNTFRSSLDSLSRLSSYSSDHEGETNGQHLSHIRSDVPIPSRSPAPQKTWKNRWNVFWNRNKGVTLVLLSQFFGALMVVTTRLLETDESNEGGMEPFQVLFARMSITSLLCGIYMWWAKVPDAPFGKRSIQGLLVVRGVGGFFGVYGIYYSLIYLPVAEATVITFLAPILACWACSFFIHEPFTRKEQFAGLVSLLGVVLIARPASFFSGQDPPSSKTTVVVVDIPINATSTFESNGLDNVTPAQRLIAVGVGLIGVCGAACAYTTIRWIGQRAHPLISVNYFAVWCTIVSTVALVAIPSVHFQLPSGFKEWMMLLSMGTCGFVMQFLLTAGLQHEKSSRATNMVYTQMLFALTFDKLIWNTTPGIWSIIGSALILGSAVYVAVLTNNRQNKPQSGEGRVDEEVGLVAGEEGREEDDGMEGGRGPMRGVQEVQLRAIRV